MFLNIKCKKKTNKILMKLKIAIVGNLLWCKKTCCYENKQLLGISAPSQRIIADHFPIKPHHKVFYCLLTR